VPRPPVCPVMGHVDHGKTKLLDAIRSTDVVAGEAGASPSNRRYQVHTSTRASTGPDHVSSTPRSRGLTAMRARGAKVTDLAVLVVAATTA